MRQKDITPIIGLSVIVAIWILWGLQAYREKEAASPSTALPEITSATQPMTVDEIHLHLRRSLDAASPGFYALDVDKEAGTITVDQWSDGFNADAANAALRSKEYLLKWNGTLQNARELGEQIQNLVSDHGHPELTVIYRVVNDDDHGQIFAVVERGALIYDVVADTPPGEQVPDPSIRVTPTETQIEQSRYVVNTASGVFHAASCTCASQIADYNRASFTGDRADLISQGLRPCEICKP